MGQRKNDGLFLRGSIYWISFTDAGIHYRRSTGTANKEIAQKIYNILKGKIALGNWHPETLKTQEDDPEYTFAELAVKYSEYATGRLRSWDRHLSYLVDQLKREFVGYMLTDFSTHEVEKYQTKLINKKLSVCTINRHIAVLKILFARAVAWKMCSREDQQQVRAVKPLKGVNKRLRFLSKEESQNLIGVCDPHLKPIVVTALNTGMRKGEILSLKWEENVDLKHGFILLKADETKNGEKREIPINDTLRAVLQGIMRRLDVPYVFHDPLTGQPYRDVKRSFKTALKNVEVEKCTKCDYQKARDMIQKSMEHCPLCNSEILVQKGIADFHFHDLRHTFASQLVMAGVDLTTVKELLGHKDIKMTLRYAHLAAAHKVEALKKLEGSFVAENQLSRAANL